MPIEVYDSSPSTSSGSASNTSNTSSSGSSVSSTSSPFFGPLGSVFPVLEKKTSASKKSPNKGSVKNSPNKGSAKNSPNKGSVKKSPSKGSAKKSPNKGSAKKSPSKARNSAQMSSATKRKNALEKISSAYRFKTNTSKKHFKKRLRSYYLQGICSDSGVCIAFNKESDKIYEYFKGFVDFKLVDMNAIERIGAQSTNGSIYLLPYKKKHYQSHAILKIPQVSTNENFQNDNIFYEYLNGRLLNDLCDNYPCLVMTYTLLFNNSNNTKFPESLLSYQPTVFNSKTKGQLIKGSCKNPLRLSLLLQYFKDSVTINHYVKKMKYEYDELIKCLFQVYYFLHQNREVFTHNDLHMNNVLLYEPVKGGKIHYTYHLECGEKIEFTSKYIPKIIDYGRCYTSHSEKLYEQLCYFCEKCGFYDGYQFFHNNHPNNVPNYYTSLYANVSQDLRLYAGVYSNVSNKHKMRPCIYKSKYGTPPIAENDRYEEYIANVTDCYKELTNQLRKIVYQPESDNIATIEVYGDKPMKTQYHQKRPKAERPMIK